MTQAEKGARFRALHEERRAFLLPNPWDAGTARLLASLGFEALATTSAGFAFSQGSPDLGFDSAGSTPASKAKTAETLLARFLANAQEIAAATGLPVTADLGNGFGADLDAVANTYRQAGAAGLVGASIEDATESADQPIFVLSEAVDRVQAAVAAVRALPFPFLLTARAENFLHGKKDLADTIARLQAYQEAGADVLYAPGLTRLEDIATVARSVDRPLNVLMGFPGAAFGASQLKELGIARISVGSALSRAAFGAVLRAAREMLAAGTFKFAEEGPSHRELNALFSKGGAR